MKTLPYYLNYVPHPGEPDMPAPRDTKFEIEQWFKHRQSLKLRRLIARQKKFHIK
jgi:hypothetical protein